MKMIVIKRDGNREGFDINKVRRAVLATFSHGAPDVTPLIDRIVTRIITSSSGRELSVEDIGSVIVEEMASSGFDREAEAFVRYRNERSRLREERLTPNTKLLSDYIHASKYMRGFETWDQTVERYLSSLPRRPSATTVELLLNKKILPSMRGLQFGGLAVNSINERLYNCSFTLVDRPSVFGRILFLLLCGCGVGYSVQFRHVLNLPKLKRISKRHVRHWTISDSIEGWAAAVDFLVDSYINMGYYVEFDYSQIRPEGAPLITSGGIAPGHFGIKKSLERIRQILDEAQGRQLRPIECHDMICGLARCVLSGGIRRASLAALFDYDDLEMFNCKSGATFDFNSDRTLCNNSCVLERCDPRLEYKLSRVLEASQEYGEPGFFFTNHPDYGTNPCFEIGLNPKLGDETGFAFCNLTEINVSNCEDAEDFYSRCVGAAELGTLQSAIINFKDINDVLIARRDRLLGVSLTGILDNPSVGLNKDILERGAMRVCETNLQVSKELGILSGARLTCVKPSGTASLLLGCVGSGVHPHHARRYFRRVTANPNERAAKIFKKYNPHMVFVRDNGDWAITFPIKARDDAKLIRDFNAKEFLSIVKRLYTSWVLPGHISGANTHSVSATCVCSPSELEGVRHWLLANKDSVAAVSFVPPSVDKIYPLAPREEVVNIVDETLWNQLIKNSVPVDYSEINNTKGVVDLGSGCEGPKCDIS